MSGPSVKIPADWLDRDETELLGSDVAMLMLSALGYSARQVSEGVVPRRRLRKLWPVDDVEKAIELLVAAGEVDDRGDELHFIRWRDFILEADEVERIRENNRLRDERRRRHNRGDHSQCTDRCGAKQRENSRGSTREKPRGPHVGPRVSHADPTRPDPTRPIGRGGEGGGTATGSAGATPAAGPEKDTPLVPHEYELPPDADPDDDDRWQLPCPQCGHPESHIVHMACEWETDPNDPRACINCGERWEFAGAHAAYEAYRIAVEEGRPWRPGAA